MTYSERKEMTPSPCMNCFTLVCGARKCLEMEKWIEARRKETNARLSRIRKEKDLRLDEIFAELDKYENKCKR